MRITCELDVEEEALIVDMTLYDVHKLVKPKDDVSFDFLRRHNVSVFRAVELFLDLEEWPDSEDVGSHPNRSHFLNKQLSQ